MYFKSIQGDLKNVAYILCNGYSLLFREKKYITFSMLKYLYFEIFSHRFKNLKQYENI